MKLWYLMLIILQMNFILMYLYFLHKIDNWLIVIRK
jgi:hypothetical protein